MGDARETTVFIHGTWASEETWWLPGEDDSAADRLETRLQRRGLSGSVWRGLRDQPDVVDLASEPVSKQSAIQNLFTWSGLNSHSDRVNAAGILRTSMERLAEHHGCSPADPLPLHVVAHSHGGNVLLEVLKQPPESVEIRSVSMLGTPLVWRFPTLRLFWVVLAALWTLLVLISAGLALSQGGASLPSRVLSAGLLLTFGPWLFLALMMMFEKAARFAKRALAKMRGRRLRGRPAYGPHPKDLAGKLQRPILLFRSAEDEADLMMHFGASPRDFYDRYVRRQRPRRGLGVGAAVIWVIETLWVRPVAMVLGVPVLEILVERFGLGFNRFNSIRGNYEMVSQRDRDFRFYPESVVRRVDVTTTLIPALRERLHAGVELELDEISDPDGSGATTEDGIRSHAEHVDELGRAVKNITAGLKHKFHLRHSLYYTSEAVLDLVADEIAAASLSEQPTKQRVLPA